MDDPVMYVNANSLQLQDTTDEMNLYSHIFHWGPSEKILDIGCGPGDVTSVIQNSYIPTDASIMAVDLSQRMVDYANATYSNERMTFSQLNIEDVDWDIWNKECYNKVFSFFCLHWVGQQKTALGNIYKFLKTGGHMFVVLIAQSPIFQLYRDMSRDTKWRPYMQDVEKFVSKYHDSENPLEDFQNHLSICGFRNINVILKRKSFYYSSIDALIATILAVNPFYKRIPVGLRPNFREDVQRRAILLTDECSERIRTTNCLITAFATK